MPQQQYDENTERVAGMRRLEDDDQWLNPHNLYLAMFSPSTVHVLPFDPHHGADTARQYAGKYASKPEKWYPFFFTFVRVVWQDPKQQREMSKTSTCKTQNNSNCRKDPKQLRARPKTTTGKTRSFALAGTTSKLRGTVSGTS